MMSVCVHAHEVGNQEVINMWAILAAIALE